MTWKQIKSAPRDGENILLTDGATIFLAYCNGDEPWRDAWDGDTILFTPTHWMPLPEPPK